MPGTHDRWACAMTLIEIKSHSWGWKIFRAPGVEPVFPEKRQAIDYAQCRANFRSGEIRILDSSGKLVRHYPPKPEGEGEGQGDEGEGRGRARPVKLTGDAGLNRFVWDLHYQGANRVPGYYLWEYNDGGRGPLALPGSYRVRLTAQGKLILTA